MSQTTKSLFNNVTSSEARTPTIVIENHPADSRLKISDNGIFQTLSGRMGTGGVTCRWLVK